MKFMATIIFAAALSFALGACNTMRGVGKDVERGGEKVQDAATGAQKNR
jgi:predicted small secreted protein